MTRKGELPLLSDVQKLRLMIHSLVFTSWRSTLDLLANMLADRGIAYLRIDGRVSFSDRSHVISKFCKDSNIPVLLMSFETGAVGYDSPPRLVHHCFIC